MNIYRFGALAANVPWDRVKAYEAGESTFAEPGECLDCTKPLVGHTLRYVEGEACVRCASEDAGRWLRGEKLRVLKVYPGDVPIRWSRHDPLDKEAPQYDVGAPRICHNGPHFRKEDGDGECVRCLTVLGRPMAKRQVRANLRVSKLEALANGHPLYFDTPCTHGHEGWRRVEDGRCWECSNQRGSTTPQEQLERGVVVDRQLAKHMKLPLYLGKRCPEGHDGWKYTASGKCYQCSLLAPVPDFMLKSSDQIRRGVAVTRKEASERGLKLYKGKPCRKGHDGWRWNSTGNCFHCAKEDRPVRLPSVPRLGTLTPAAQYADGTGKPITREDARLKGFSLYKGNPCKLGHDGWRRVDSGACYGCLLGHGKRSPRDMRRDVATLLGYDEFYEQGRWVK